MKKQMKKIIRKLSVKIPVLEKILLFYRRKRKYIRQDKTLENESRMKVFSDIYSNKVWGGYEVDFYSGWGSYFEELIFPYCAEIRKFVQEKKIKSIVDFGCGDFNVASKFVSDNVEYIGVDIVPELIKRNSEKFSSKHICFVNMDIVNDEAPEADLCLVREVFQHLSNKEILQTLKHMKKYKYLKLRT